MTRATVFISRQPHFAPRGFSLVELMVAMALSLILLGGVVAIFASSKTTYETTDRLSRIQENGRFALDTITRDIRSSGYVGCSYRAPFRNSLNHGTNVLWNFEHAVQGYEAASDGFAPTLDASVIINPAAGSDILVVRYPRHDSRTVRVAARMEDPDDDITLDTAGASAIEANDVVMISDCDGREVFEVSAKTGDVISHTASAPGEGAASASPGNASGEFGRAFTANAEVIPVETAVYFLRDSTTPGGGTSLWRRIGGGGAAQELVEGVEAMQVAYGETSGSDVVYRRADEVADWANVVSVTVALLVRSPSEYGGQVEDRSFALLGDLGEVIPAPNDRRMRQIFTTTVNIRNATL